MSIDTNQVAGAHNRSLLTRWLAGAAVTALAVTGFLAQDSLGATAAHAAGESVSVQTTVVQQGAYQTFFVDGLKANTLYYVYLGDPSVTPVTPVGEKSFTTDTAGDPPAGLLRMQVDDDAPIGSNYDVAIFENGGSWPVATSVSKISVIAPNTSASVTATVIEDGDFVRVEGTGFRRVNTAYNSVIGVKLDNGAIKHSDTLGDYAPVPKPYPAAGSSPVDVWFYIGNGNITTGSDGAYNGSTGYPNEDYASNDIVGGSFTVDIPIDTVPSGTHTLRFLTGSLDDATWQTPSSVLNPDQGRSVTVNFTK